MDFKIGKQAVQITGYKVLPGLEFEVAKELKAVLKRRKVNYYSMLKGFGAFDIILITKQETFRNDISRKHISGVLKTIQFPCFFYDQGTSSNSNFEKDISTKPFVGISLLKINPNSDGSHLKKLKDLIQYLTVGDKGVSVKRFIFGTVGWNEVILCVCVEDINEIIKELFWATEQEDNALVSKSLSFVSLNYELLFKINESLSNNEEILSINPTLKADISENLYPVIMISAEPVFCYELGGFWDSDKFNVMDSLGEEDLIVIPRKNKGVTWSYFISKLLEFRRKFNEHILYTKIRINKNHVKKIETSEGCTKLYETKDKFVVNLEKFSSELRPRLESNINHLNEMLDNRITGKAFEDMVPYSRYLTDVTLGSDLEKRLVEQASQVIRYGVELRLFGTYGTTEDVSSKTSVLRGGVQQVLIALATIPQMVARKRLGYNWDGFIIASDYKFSTINEVINVPFDALFNPHSWWALYHEFAHLFIAQHEKLVNTKINNNFESIKIFLANKREPNSWLILITEILAEIIGFEIGFFNDYKCFLQLVWKYLIHIYSIDNSDQLEQYVVRTFFVEIYYRLYKVKDIKPEELEEVDDVYILLLKHIKQIEINIGYKFKAKKYFIAAKNAKNIMGLMPFLEDAQKVINHEFIMPLASEKNSSNTRKVIRDIKKGIVYTLNIESVEAVLYNFFKMNKLSFEQEIALILSFSSNYSLLGPMNRNNANAICNRK